MPKVFPDDRLNRLAKATNEQINNWKEGVSIQDDFGQAISDLISKAAADRWQFAYEHRHNANKFLKFKPPLYRSAISRYYYSMYHAMRACVFVSYGGDDNQEHREIPSHIPQDFPPSAPWPNILKDARYHRNRADYDPYPKSRTAWKADALQLKKDADLFLSTTRTYLRSKGCRL